MNQDHQLLEQEVLRTLSHFEPMSLEYIFLDFDKKFLESFPDLTIEDLDKILKKLVKKKKIKSIKVGEQIKWLKLFPKKKLRDRILNLFKK